MGHRDHRFEWTRTQFRGWADAVAAGYGYAVRYVRSRIPQTRNSRLWIRDEKCNEASQDELSSPRRPENRSRSNSVGILTRTSV